MDYSPIKDNNFDIENLIKSLDKDVEIPPHKGNQVNTMNWFVKFPKQNKIDLEAVARMCQNLKINFKYQPDKYLNLTIYTQNPFSKVMIFKNAIMISKIIPTQELSSESILKIYQTIYNYFIKSQM
tara:strand:- start:9 stop:386 length:378 start_codon:yes stop_codon:yes gene_type:complete